MVISKKMILPAEIYKNIDVVLASNSPRRRELLFMLLPAFIVAESRDVDESYPDQIPAEEVPVYISKAKAAAYSDMLTPGRLLLTADTVVICDGEILGKPHGGRQAAIDMLRKLSGRTHSVVTGVTLTSDTKSESFSEVTKVTFAELPGALIEEYVDLAKPYDKAGAYGIQEWIGAVGISGIEGCYYNVMGLPVHALYNHLRDFYKTGK